MLNALHLHLYIVANEVLNAGSAEEAKTIFSNLLSDTFENESFKSGVLNGDAGGGTQVFEGNIISVFWYFSVNILLQLHC